MSQLKEILTKRTAVPVWALVVGALVLLGLGSAAGSSSAEKDAASSVTATTQFEGSTGISTLAPTTVVTSPSTTEPPKTWQQVATLSGSSAKRGTPFRLNGDARLTWNSKAGFFAVYVVEAGKNIQEEGGFPETTCAASCADTTQMPGRSGDYYLDVNASGGQWTVTVEELR